MPPSITEFRQFQRRSARDVARSAVLDLLCVRDLLTAGFKTPLADPDRPIVHVLLLHHVFRDEEEPFRRILSSLAPHYRFVTYSQAVAAINTGTGDGPMLAVTFDDGLATCVKAASILEEFDAKGCFFVCPNLVGESDPGVVGRFCRERLAMPLVDLMGWDDLCKLQALGHEVGGHTCSHARISNSSPQQTADEIGSCYDQLVRQLGRVEHFAWPYGAFDDFSRVGLDETRKAGFLSCASGVRGCHDASVKESCNWVVRRESLSAGWPLRHVRHFLRASASAPLVPSQTIPAWLSGADASRVSRAA